MGLNRDISAMRFDAAEKALEAIGELDRTGIKYFINETLRSADVQRAYYSKGRDTPEQTDILYRKAGLPKPDNYNKITWTQVSLHESGLAIDIYPVSPGGQIIWNYTEANKAQWQQIADVMTKYSFEWGGKWAEKDYPHYQFSTK